METYEPSILRKRKVSRFINDRSYVIRQLDANVNQNYLAILWGVGS